MSGTPIPPEDPILEDARTCLREIMGAYETATDEVGLYIQQIAQAGIIALDALPSCPEAQQLAGTVAQEVDECHNLLQSLTCVDEVLENDLLELLGAIYRIQEKIPGLSDGSVIGGLQSLEEDIRELSARIVWRIVASEGSGVATAVAEEAGGAPSSPKLVSQAADDSSSFSMLGFLDEAVSFLGVDAQDADNSGSSSQSTTADERLARRLQLEEYLAATVADTIPPDNLPSPSGSAVLAVPRPSNRHRGETFHFEEIQKRGTDLLTLFMREGDLQNLSNSVSLLRESMILCPSNPEQRLRAAGNLAVALLTQYEQKGDYSDLIEAITLNRELLDTCPPGHPNRASSLHNLSHALCVRYEREGCLSDLSEAIGYNREAVSLRPPPHPRRAASLNNLSNALLIRYQRGGSLSDLSEAIEHTREALSLRPHNHPDRASSLNNLSNALFTRYELGGSLFDLSEAIEHNREALTLRPPGHPDRATSLNNLSGTLTIRYQREGSLFDLSEAIDQYREALSLRPSGHPGRGYSFNNLSTALFTRYQREGSISDLSEAIERGREALILHPSGHPHRSSCLTNLSCALFTRYEHEGSLSDLSEAIKHNREALSLHPAGHPDRAISLNNLSIAVFTRYECEGSLSDLSEAIEHFREALSLRSPGHPERASSLTNLSSALLIRYEREGSLSDLSEAIEQYREALNLHLPGRPDRVTPLNNLSNALVIRYQCEGGLSDLSEAIDQCREALSLLPSGHPDRGYSLNNLSNALYAWYHGEGSIPDLSEAIEQYREALGLHPPGHPDRAASLSNLSSALLTRYKCEDCLPDLSEAIGQCREALTLCPSGHPNRSVVLVSLCRALWYDVLRTTDDPDQQSHRTLANEVFTMFHEAVDLPTCPPLDRLKAALQWIDAARQLDSLSMLSAYGAALDLLDIVLATSNSLENKHVQLASSDALAQCRRLGVEAASYAVREGHMALAVEFLERGRNLLFAQIGRYRVDLEDLRRVNVELADRFSNLSNLLDVSVASNQPTSLEGRTVFEDSSERYRRVSSSWSRVVDNIRAVEGFKHFLKPPSYEALRAIADEGPVIIVIPGRDQSDALIISQERNMPHHVTLPEAGEDKLVELVDALVEAVHSDDDLATEEFVKKILRSLWILVVRPIADAPENEPHVPLHSRIWWCPTSFFSSLPLHAAGRYTSKQTTENLPDRYVSSYTPTLHALLRSRRNRGVSKRDKVLIVAQPNTPGQSQLPNALPEAKRVKELLETKMDSALLSGEEGSHAAVLSDIPNHPWLHLTCHGSQDFDNPFQSCFCLHDGNLTLSDIMRRGLPDAKFAFLAACHTATGDSELRDEGLHLAAGLQFAGFKSVIGTIWEVADIDGPAIAEAFYKALQLEQSDEEGMDCSKAAYALSRAVKQLRENGVPPSRWMRFVHIGI